MGLLLALLGSLATALAAVPESLSRGVPVITNLNDFYRLSPEAIRKGCPVRFRGTVVYYDPAWGQLQVYDGHLTQYLYPSPEIQTPLERGQRVEITGRSALVNGEYRCTNTTVRILGRGDLPTPIVMPLAKLGTNVNQFVEITGQVRGFRTSTGRAALSVADSGQSCTAYVLHHPLDLSLRRWAGSLVRVRGVNGSRLNNARLDAIVFVADTDDVLVLRSPEKPLEELPAVPIGSLLRTDGKEPPGSLIRVQGLVTSVRAGDSLTLKDPTGTLLVRTDSQDTVAIDQRVDAWGFPEWIGNQVVLADAFYDVAGSKDAAPVGTAPTEPVVVDTALPILETTRAIRQLTRQEAMRHYPVKLRAIVTYADAEWGNGFLQDASGGVYVVLARTNQLAPGQRVEVSGFTDVGTFVPFVIQPQFTPLDTTNLPSPVRVRLGDLMTGEYDSYWVELEGIIRRLTESVGHLYLDLATQNGRVRLIVPRASAEATAAGLIDARVRVTGACGAELNTKGNLAGIVIHCPSLDYLQVIDRPPVDSFALPTTPLGSLARIDPQMHSGHRIKVSGVVTYEAPDRSFILQDRSGAARVWAAQTNRVQVGNTLDVVAWPAQGDFSPELHEGLFRATDKQPSPQPVPVTADQVLRYGTNDAKLVEIEARLLERKRSTGASFLLLQQGPVIFEAGFPTSDTVGLPAKLQAGALLRLTGICAIQGDQRRDPKSFQILLRSVREVEVLQAAPWWTPQYAVIGFGALLGVIALGTTWVVLLRRQVARHTKTIRQRLANEAALERRYQDLVENASDIVYTSDMEGRITSVNRAGERASGYSRTEMLGRKTEEMAVPEHRALIRERLAARSRGADLPPLEIGLLTRDGRQIDVEVKSQLVYQEGRPTAVEGIARDITARKRAEEALKRSEERFSKVFRASPIAVCITRLADGRYCDANESFLRLVEFGREELIGHTSLELGIWAQPKDRENMVKRLQDSSSVRDMEMQLRTRTGRIRQTLASLEIIELDSQPCVLGIIHDVTERLQLEAQFRQAQKMESIGQLAAGVAHDFNNLLTVIQGYTAILGSPNGSADETSECVSQISEAAKRAANLTHQLLAFSRRQVMRPDRLNLNETVTSLSRMLPRLLGEHIALQVHCEPGLPDVYADAGMLDQVLMNLAVNARDAMPNGGQLVFRTRLLRIDAQHLRENPEVSLGECVCLCVTDTGGGMDAATLGHLFEPFFTTKDVGKGTGLGLATVYGIVKQHKGWLEVSSQVGQGSTFRVYLPVMRGPKEGSPAALPPEPLTAPGKGTILLVEDELALRRLARRVLEKNGYRILEASSGAEALKTWVSRNVQIDLLVTDMVMPGGIGGRELAQRLQAEDAGLKVLYTSGYSVEMVGAGFVLQEGVNFLPKPYLPAVLINAVTECLAAAEGRSDTPFIRRT